MKRYRVTILSTPDSTTLDFIVESKQSAKAIMIRYLRKYPDCYEISVNQVQ